MWAKHNQQGFTIVELLIVIVVIAILAGITIVAYNGIQNKAKTSTGAATEQTFIQKVEAVNSLIGRYPGSDADFELYPDTSIAGKGFTFSPVLLDGTQSPSTLLYSACGPTVMTATGAKIRYWDFTNGILVNISVGTLTGTCTILAL
jgi:prepilin-type N-terminal cleavage/methylation domain-containing protein